MPLFLPQPDSGPVYYFRQYFGAFCILCVVLLLVFCYGSDVMTDNQLTFLVVTLAIVGLVFHEMRPFKVKSVLLPPQADSLCVAMGEYCCRGKQATR